MGTGTDIASESAGITLVKGDLRGIVRARHLSRAVMRNIRQNLFLAFVYNPLGVPIAAGALYPFLGILLCPKIGRASCTERACQYVKLLGVAVSCNKQPNNHTTQPSSHSN